ncbi:hypothetical protein ACJX0J_024733, partial [Zea mays]
MHLIILVFSGHLAKGGVFGINQEGLGKNIHNGLLLVDSINVSKTWYKMKRRTELFERESLGSSKKTKKIYSRLDFHWKKGLAHNMPIPIRANNASHDYSGNEIPLAFLLSTCYIYMLWLE